MSSEHISPALVLEDGADQDINIHDSFTWVGRHVRATDELRERNMTEFEKGKTRETRAQPSWKLFNIPNIKRVIIDARIKHCSNITSYKLVKSPPRQFPWPLFTKFVPRLREIFCILPLIQPLPRSDHPVAPKSAASSQRESVLVPGS
jgi:hypothetical protein